MSVLKSLSNEDGWIDLEQPNENSGPNTIGIFNGENVNYGFRSNEEGETFEGDDYRIYQSGPYTIEACVSEGGERRVRVSQHDVSDRTYTTSPVRTSDGGYEINLPTLLVRHLGLDEIAETGSREVDGETQNINRGIPLRITAEWDENGVAFVLTPLSVDEDTSPSNVRRVQHKPVGDYTQYFIYFPRSLIAMFGASDAEFNWNIVDEDLVGVVKANEMGRNTPNYLGNKLGEALLNAPVRDTPFRVVTFEDDPRAVDTITVGDTKVAIREREESYTDVDTEDRTLPINSRGASGQLRINLRNEMARGLGLLPDKKAEMIQEQGKPSAVWLAEWTPEGIVYVLHTDPSVLPDGRKSKQTRVTLAINNWIEPASTTDTPSERFEKAGNQVAINFPKGAGAVLGLADEEMYWWPADDEFYTSGDPIFIGRRVSDISEE